MRKKERYEKVIAWFQDNIPVAETELHYNNPYELLIAVILSAQCTDKRVNIITPPLYKDFPTPEALAATTPEVIFEYIRSVSYPNNKAKHLVGMAKMLVNDFNSEVPDNLEDLIKLPGVGRKTANVIQSVVFKKAAMAVDTHVFRVSHRIGLVPDSCTTPFSVEKELVKNIPEKLIPIAHHWLILHGRYVCQARTPKCDTCGLQMMCKYFCNTYKVTKEDKLTDSELNAIREGVNDRYELTRKSVTEGYDIDFDITVKGNDDEMTSESSAYIVKIDGGWYITDASGHLGLDAGLGSLS